MNRIEKLIEELCPQGVEYKEFGKVCDIVTDYVAAGSFADIAKNVKYLKEPNYAQLIRTTDVKSKFKSDNFIYVSEKAFNYLWRVNLDTESIIMPNVGNCGEIYFLSPELLPYKNNVLGPNAILVRSNSSNLKFLYYLFQGIEFQKELNKITTPSGQSKFNKTALKKILIPVPPLPIQEEIVNILDKFTTLEAELEAELEARKSQYEYYRNELLTPIEKDGKWWLNGVEVEWKELQEIFDMKNGYTPSKSKKEYWTNGTVPWFRMEDIRENGRILSKSIQYITQEAVKGSGVFPANSIIVSTSATIGEHALITIDFLANQRFTCLTVKEKYSDYLSMWYFQYYMFIIDEWCKKNINISGFAGVDMPKFRQLRIPLPPLSEQERIVSILDKFDALVNDITVGLPAEIEARRKQYEYYRNKLLTFEEQ